MLIRLRLDSGGKWLRGADRKRWPGVAQVTHRHAGGQPGGSRESLRGGKGGADVFTACWVMGVDKLGLQGSSEQLLLQAGETGL